MAGGINAAASVSGYKPLSEEAVIAAAPDLVLVMARGQIVADETPRALLGGAGGEQAQSLIAVHRDAARRLIDLQQ